MTGGICIILRTLAIAFAMACCLACLSQARSMQPAFVFYQLTTAQGLSDNYINDLCTDKAGNLWIATGEGLNMFNGKTVVRFFKQQYPHMHNDFTRQVVCDSANRLWVLQEGGLVSLYDENRQCHKVVLYLGGKNLPVLRMISTTAEGPVLLTPMGFFKFNPAGNYHAADSLTISSFKPLPIAGLDSQMLRRLRPAGAVDANHYLLANDSVLVQVSFQSRRVSNTLTARRMNFLAPWSNQQWLMYSVADSTLGLLDVETNRFSKQFAGLRDQYGKPMPSLVRKALWINHDQVLLTTPRHGLCLLSRSTGKIFNYRHDASDPGTLVNNWPAVLATDSTGWVFVGATPHGISYFKSNAVVGQRTLFADRKGNSYDGFVAGITTTDNDTYFLVVPQNLIKWKRSTNTTEFLGNLPAFADFARYDVNYVMADRSNRIWASVPGSGLYVFDAATNRFIKFILFDTAARTGTQVNVIRHLYQAPDGYIWLSTRRGVMRVHPDTYRVDRMEHTPVQELRNTPCNYAWFSDNNTAWVCTDGKGVWKFNLAANTVEKLTTENGMLSNKVLCINQDLHQNVYVGSQGGIDLLLANGRHRQITTANGLLNNRAEALLCDRSNRMWIGNDVALGCYTLADSSLRMFDERYGLSVQGFRVYAYHQNSDDELVWGTERGIQFFYPDQLVAQKISFNTMVSRASGKELQVDLTADTLLRLAPDANFITFEFSTTDYSKHLRTFYEYRLLGVDEGWTRLTDQYAVRYSALPSGRFTFLLRASNDGIHWTDASNKVTLVVQTAFYRQLWFRVLALLAVALLAGWMLYNYRRKQQQKQRELETQLVITWFSSQINRHHHASDLLWDLAKNCISKLQFEDCVIYLKDEKRNVLVQRAAYGPKNPVDFTIHQPIEIPVGSGIVGSVAKTGRAEMIGNTELDSRYIVDDERRYSELAVPIIIDGEVVGVIDSEHIKKHFFTSRHLNILTTVAALCANQLKAVQAEEEKQQTRLELLEKDRKAAEWRLQSLRLQMNPHFLFNALNSIQQMILAGEELVATRYLSRFSKLLRTVLIHSDKEYVTLKEEIDILKLYIELEAVRFKESFSHSVHADENLDTEELRIPTLLVQPFVENAIWHGLMHKDGEKRLTVSFAAMGDFVLCTVEDNGVGRGSAAANGTGRQGTHTGKGIRVSEERLAKMRNAQGQTGSVTITDLFDAAGKPAGTRVSILFPA